MLDGNSSIISMQFAYAAQRAAELFKYFGQTEKAEKYTKLSDQITKAVYEKCWDESRNYLADYSCKKRIQHACPDICRIDKYIPEDKQKAFTERFMNDNSLTQPTMYFRFYLTQALKKPAWQTSIWRLSDYGKICFKRINHIR